MAQKIATVSRIKRSRYINSGKQVELLKFKMAPHIFESILLRGNIRNNRFQVQNVLLVLREKRARALHRDNSAPVVFLSLSLVQ